MATDKDLSIVALCLMTDDDVEEFIKRLISVNSEWMVTKQGELLIKALRLPVSQICGKIVHMDTSLNGSLCKNWVYSEMGKIGVALSIRPPQTKPIPFVANSYDIVPRYPTYLNL